MNFVKQESIKVKDINSLIDISNTTEARRQLEIEEYKDSFRNEENKNGRVSGI